MNSNKSMVLYKLEDMTTSKLIEQEAKANNVTVTDQDMDKELTIFKESFGSVQEYNLALQNRGLTLDSVKEQLRSQIEIRKILLPQTKVTEDQIQAYYNENKDAFGNPEELEASHILVDTEQEAKDIITQLNKGADFATLAKQKSKDTSNSTEGGNLGYFQRGVLELNFENAAYALKVGELSKQPAKSTFGYHVIKVTGHKDAAIRPLDEVKEKIKWKLEDEAVHSLYIDWMAGLKSKATITNTLGK